MIPLKRGNARRCARVRNKHLIACGVISAARSAHSLLYGGGVDLFPEMFLGTRRKKATRIPPKKTFKSFSRVARAGILAWRYPGGEGGGFFRRLCRDKLYSASNFTGSHSHCPSPADPAPLPHPISGRSRGRFHERSREPDRMGEDEGMPEQQFAEYRPRRLRGPSNLPAPSPEYIPDPGCSDSPFRGDGLTPLVSTLVHQPLPRNAETLTHR